MGQSWRWPPPAKKYHLVPRLRTGNAIFPDVPSWHALSRSPLSYTQLTCFEAILGIKSAPGRKLRAYISVPLASTGQTVHNSTAVLSFQPYARVALMCGVIPPLHYTPSRRCGYLTTGRTLPFTRFCLSLPTDRQDDVSWRDLRKEYFGILFRSVPRQAYVRGHTAWQCVHGPHCTAAKRGAIT